MRAIILSLIVASRIAAAEPPPASPEQVARDFFTYLAENHIDSTGLDISSDSEAQERFLSRGLRDALHAKQHHVRRHRPKSSNGIPIPPPDNSAFLLAWDPPRRFTVTRTLQTPYMAIVEGRAIWLAGQQYEHEVRPTFFVLVFERGAWRVHDIQAAKAEFNPDMSLLDSLTLPSKRAKGT